MYESHGITSSRVRSYSPPKNFEGPNELKNPIQPYVKQKSIKRLVSFLSPRSSTSKTLLSPKNSVEKDLHKLTATQHPLVIEKIVRRITCNKMKEQPLVLSKYRCIIF